VIWTRLWTAASVLFINWFVTVPSYAQADNPLGFDPYFTFAGNFDLGYHKTQFFEPDHNVVVGQWDTRAEVWLPPFRRRFSWGPYVRVTGIAASQSEAWENAWLGGPGIGFQVYPFSLPWLRESASAFAKIMAPLRIFAEYNRVNYWGPENSWRPKRQKRIGGEHWRSLHVNDGSSFWWTETWNGLWWQSANEFTPTYRTLIFANALRGGLRVPNLHVFSAFTPYVAFESSLTDNSSYYWENRLLSGGGLRFAPSLKSRFQRETKLNRFAIYAEYLRVGTYYRETAPASIPNYEVRIGVTFSTGLWYQ
jgi:hypothetical protein